MNLWKEGVTNKLSRLLSETSSCTPPQQELSFDEKESSCRKRSSFSSVFFSIFPISCSGAGQSPSCSPQDPRVSPSRSHSKRWKLDNFNFKDRPLKNASNAQPESNNDFIAVLATENDNNVPEGSILPTVTTQGLSSSVDHAESLPHLMEKSIFVSADLFDFLQICLPNIVKGCQWVMLYSTMKHGISLRTLIRRSAILAGPCLLIVGDMQGAIFGGLLDSPLKPTVKRKYQGTNQTFVFTTIYGEPRLFRATGANRYYYLCLNDIVAFGGGGGFALSLEEDLLHGTSGPSETFGNLCLAHTKEFELKNVELWGFTHSSRYLI